MTTLSSFKKQKTNSKLSLYEDVFMATTYPNGPNDVRCSKHVFRLNPQRKIRSNQWVRQKKHSECDSVVQVNYFCDMCQDNVFKYRLSLKENPLCKENLLRRLGYKDEADRLRDERLATHKAEDDAIAAKKARVEALKREGKDPRGNKRRLELAEKENDDDDDDDSLHAKDLKRLIGLRIAEIRRITEEECTLWKCCTSDWVVVFDDGTMLHPQLGYKPFFELNPSSYVPPNPQP